MVRPWVSSAAQPDILWAVSTACQPLDDGIVSIVLFVGVLSVFITCLVWKLVNLWFSIKVVQGCLGLSWTSEWFSPLLSRHVTSLLYDWREVCWYNMMPKQGLLGVVTQVDGWNYSCCPFIFITFTIWRVKYFWSDWSALQEPINSGYVSHFPFQYRCHEDCISLKNSCLKKESWEYNSFGYSKNVGSKFAIRISPEGFILHCYPVYYWSIYISECFSFFIAVNQSWQWICILQRKMISPEGMVLLLHGSILAELPFSFTLNRDAIIFSTARAFCPRVSHGSPVVSCHGSKCEYRAWIFHPELV